MIILFVEFGNTPYYQPHIFQIDLISLLKVYHTVTSVLFVRTRHTLLLEKNNHCSFLLKSDENVSIWKRYAKTSLIPLYKTIIIRVFAINTLITQSPD